MNNKKPKLIIRDSFETVVLVCFLLNEIGDLTEENLLEIVTIDELVEIFMLSDALGVCENKRLIQAIEKNNEHYYEITSEGKAILNEFINTLSYEIKEKVLDDGKRIISLKNLRKSIRWNILETEKGYYFNVTFLNEMGGPDIMQIKIYAPSKETALDIEKRFLEKPIDIISNTINMFISDSFL